MNRAQDYQNTLSNLKKRNKQFQLNKINLYLNQLLPQYDDVIYNREDNWATPKEFLTNGYGDCEDYVIIKYYSLIKLGFKEKNLYLTGVKERYKGGLHMVLTYFTKRGKAPLILDNLSFKILNAQQRTDLEILYLINESGVYTMDKKFKLTKVANYSQKFVELQEKVQNNR